MSERLKAVEVLETILEQKVFYSSLKDKINEQYLAFCNKLVLDALRNLCAIERIIKQFVKKNIPQKNIVLRYI